MFILDLKSINNVDGKPFVKISENMREHEAHELNPRQICLRQSECQSLYAWFADVEPDQQTSIPHSHYHNKQWWHEVEAKKVHAENCESNMSQQRHLLPLYIQPHHQNERSYPVVQKTKRSEWNRETRNILKWIIQQQDNRPNQHPNKQYDHEQGKHIVVNHDQQYHEYIVKYA